MPADDLPVREHAGAEGAGGTRPEAETEHRRRAEAGERRRRGGDRQDHEGSDRQQPPQTGAQQLATVDRRGEEPARRAGADVDRAQRAGDCPAAGELSSALEVISPR